AVPVGGHREDARAAPVQEARRVGPGPRGGARVPVGSGALGPVLRIGPGTAPGTGRRPESGGTPLPPRGPAAHARSPVAGGGAPGAADGPVPRPGRRRPGPRDPGPIRTTGPRASRTCRDGHPARPPHLRGDGG